MSLITEFRPLYTLNGASPKILDFPIEGGPAGGQNFTPGQCMVFNADERVQEAKDNEAQVLGVAADSALVGATALAQDQPVSVFLFDYDTVFEAAAETGGNINTRADFGGGAVWQETCDLQVLGSGLHVCDENQAAGNEHFIPIDIDATANRERLHIIGTVNCQYLVTQESAAAGMIFLTAIAAD
jgi:hypothetical protein